MWQVVYIAPNQAVGKQLVRILEDKGILSVLRPLNGGKEGSGMELLVPESEVLEAQEVLSLSLGYH